MYKDIYKKLMTLQWLLRRYQMMNCKEHNIYENRNEGQGRVLALLKIQPEIATKDMAYLFFDCLTNEELEQFSSYIDRILSSLEEMVGNPLDQEAYEWMERIQSHMGREQFEKVVEEHGFAGMPFIRRSGFEHFSHDFRGTAPEDLPGTAP